MAKPIEVTDSNFATTISAASTPVLVDFWATWCPPCRMIAPILEEIASEYEGKLQITKLDVDNNEQTAMQFDVRSLPTFIIFKEGKPVERIIGFMPKGKLLEKLKPHMS
jgi:thioredoxin 1